MVHAYLLIRHRISVQYRWRDDFRDGRGHPREDTSLQHSKGEVCEALRLHVVTSYGRTVGGE